MTDRLRDISAMAEDAVGDVRLIVHDYTASRSASFGDLGVGRFGGAAAIFGDRPTQLAVANIVGVVEHYAEQVLLAAGSSHGQVTSWGNKPSAWEAAFHVDIRDAAVCPSFEAMRGFYEARNAIMHRRGELTHSQRKRVVYDRLAAAKIERVGFSVVVQERTVISCGEVCTDCIQELDATTLR